MNFAHQMNFARQEMEIDGLRSLVACIATEVVYGPQSDAMTSVSCDRPLSEYGLNVGQVASIATTAAKRCFPGLDEKMQLLFDAENEMQRVKTVTVSGLAESIFYFFHPECKKRPAFDTFDT